MNVKSTFLLALVLGANPIVALAAGERSAQHEMESHPMLHGQDARAMQAQTHAEAEYATVGGPGDPAKVSRVIEITMHDTMRFTPSRIQVSPGETVRFFVRNPNRLRHEMVIGSVSALQEHAAFMRKMPNMHHAERNMVSLAPGQRGSIIWRFGQPGMVYFACLQPGHMEAGMVGEVEVR